MASLNLESSNQLFETLEEWNDYRRGAQVKCRPASERPIATLAIGSALRDELIRGLQLNERRLDAG